MLNADLSGRVCLVTGANSGLGYVTARELARMGAEVILVARDRGRGEAALAQLRSAAPSARASLLLCDFASLADVRRLAADVRSSGRPLHVLVNNAGLMLTERRTTVDGYEASFAVNHLAPFLLTNCLLDLLRASSREGKCARIVNVASRAHQRVSLDFDDLQSERSFDGWRAYCASKLCNVLWNGELARRLAGSGVTANALHPGVIASGFGRENTGLWRLLLTVARPFMTSPEKGADTQIYLAASPEVEGVSGQYFVDRKATPTSAAGADPAAARRLWEISERLVG